jgi:hypothetical protein
MVNIVPYLEALLRVFDEPDLALRPQFLRNEVLDFREKFACKLA